SPAEAGGSRVLDGSGRNARAPGAPGVGVVGGSAPGADRCHLVAGDLDTRLRRLPGSRRVAATEAQATVAEAEQILAPEAAMLPRRHEGGLEQPALDGSNHRRLADPQQAGRLSRRQELFHWAAFVFRQAAVPARPW